jgi:signal transduction histidine kinase
MTTFLLTYIPLAACVLILLAVCFRQVQNLNRLNKKLNDARAENFRLTRRVSLAESIMRRVLEDPGISDRVFTTMLGDWLRYQATFQNTKEKANKK